ncbi:hypothetical protein [Thermosulfurimonas sp. F29]|uniref:hypothetical protein n=1 Tax=Thermosulfurimonas sp. F29 TaxID=2867247 RepID=UPI001C82AB67|nr:hypothetical protein [Thermosulfurimonas sp. F29]MBX6422664.1 hypothetical protein [Thermosulfurimonas sp. F29]
MDKGMEGRDTLMGYQGLQLGREDGDCRYGDKMYIVRLREEPIFIGYFCGKATIRTGTFYVIQVKNTLDRIEIYLPGVVKSERELSPEERKMFK